MAQIDLDGAKRARAEENAEPHSLLWGGKDYPLPAEAPFDFAEALARADYRTALSELMSNGDSEAFFATKPSLKDVEELVNRLADLYAGKSPGES